MMRGTMMDFPLTLNTLLERAGKLYSKIEVVTRRPDKSLHRYTYGDFYRRARRLAGALQKAGLRRGDRVATLMWNHWAHLEAYFGVPAAGGVVHTLNLRLHANDLSFIVRDAGDRFLIVDDVLLPALAEFRDRVDFERMFVVPFEGPGVPAGQENYEDLLAGAPETFEYAPLDENEAAAMCYTSGTTGKPKGVVYSHRALVLHSLGTSVAEAFGITQRDVMLPVVPMFHANAWGLPFTCVMLGVKLVFAGNHLDAESVLDLFERERVTFSAGVPTIWMGILEALEKEPKRWKLAPGLQMIVGGAAAPEAMIRRYDALGITAIHSWGMTEMSPAGVVSRLKSYLEDLPEEQRFAIRARQGKPYPFVEIRAVNEAGEVPWDGATMGELHVRGPWIASSYHNRPDEADRWTADGWFRTGDVVTIDAEGYIKIVDRTKDLVKSGGEWISSVDLENALMGHPAVKEAAVISLPHPKWVERPLAVVVPREGASPSVDELRAFLGKKFSKWQLPDAIVFAKEIPRTSTGKFKKTALREQFAGWKWE